MVAYSGIYLVCVIQPASINWRHVAAVFVGLLVVFLYGKLFFRDWNGLWQDLKDADESSVDINHRWSSLKVFIWMALSIGSGIVADHQLPEWLPSMFR